MMNNEGWIKINRDICNHWIWEDSEKLKAWIDLIMLANYEDKKMPYKDSVITCKRGDVNLSFSYLAKRWGWSRKRVKAFIGMLEGDKMVTTGVTTHRTVLSLVNYGKYQDRGTTRVATKVATKEQQGYQPRNSQGNNKGSNKGNITKNIKNNKEIKEIEEIEATAPLNSKIRLCDLSEEELYDLEHNEGDFEIFEGKYVRDLDCEARSRWFDTWGDD